MKAWMRSMSFLMVAGLLASCASTYQPGSKSAPQMSVEEARETFKSFNKSYLDPTTRKIELKWAGLHVVYWSSGSQMTEEAECRFDQTSAMVTEHSGLRVELDSCPNKSSYLPIYYGSDREAAMRFADAFYVLKQNYLEKSAPETPQQQAAFEAVVKQYRATQPPPVLPEGVVRYKAQAEFAVQQKRFDDAIDLYGKALELASWWPQGRYNRGLLFGELEVYDQGVRELQKYLKLEPDAVNAKAVQTKIYQWESMVTKSPPTR